jgi:prepilin-type N-terminal cleavage/methylation domain-containing protein
MKRSGFTLIELLIVVAIIAILAAIAVPNFLEAQTRAKVSRVMADLRTLGVAIESYAVDHNKVPVDYNASASYDPALPGVAVQPSGICNPGYVKSNVLHEGLTTPISYISDCWLRDPFVSKYANYNSIHFDEQVYSYNALVDKLQGRPLLTTYITNKYREYYGDYRLGSIGPDNAWSSGDVPPAFVTIHGSRIYDPTNGTNSFGNIWRSQKSPVVTGRPLLDTLTDPKC